MTLPTTTTTTASLAADKVVSAPGQRPRTLKPNWSVASGRLHAKLHVVGAVMATWNDLPQSDQEHCAVCFGAATGNYYVVPRGLCVDDSMYMSPENLAPLCAEHSQMRLEPMVQALAAIGLLVHHKPDDKVELGRFLPPQFHMSSRVADTEYNSEYRDVQSVGLRDGWQCCARLTEQCYQLNGWTDAKKVGPLHNESAESLATLLASGEVEEKTGKDGLPYYIWSPNGYRRPVAGHIISAKHSRYAQLAPHFSKADHNLLLMCDLCNQWLSFHSPTPRTGIRYWMIAAGLYKPPASAEAGAA